MFFVVADGLSSSSQPALQHTVDVPPRYTVLSGDLAVGVVSTSTPVTRGGSRPAPLGLEIVRLPPGTPSEGERPQVTVVGSVPLVNSTATFPCGLIAVGGRYAFRFKGVDQDEQQVSRVSDTLHLYSMIRNFLRLAIQLNWDTILTFLNQKL